MCIQLELFSWSHWCICNLYWSGDANLVLKLKFTMSLISKLWNILLCIIFLVLLLYSWYWFHFIFSAATTTNFFQVLFPFLYYWFDFQFELGIAEAIKEEVDGTVAHVQEFIQGIWDYVAGVAKIIKQLSGYLYSTTRLGNVRSHIKFRPRSSTFFT